MSQLELIGLAHTYTQGAPEDEWALKPLDFTFEDGVTYALVGPSGCGKTTLLNILSGLVKPSSGQVLYDGVDVTDRDTRNRNIAQVFQFPVIYRSMTVSENLAFPLQCRGWDRARIKARVEIVADALGLGHRLGHLARRLTAADRQLISLGRGLVRDDVAALLMDEPLTVIDPQQKTELRRRIRELSEQFRPTVIYVTHDQYEAMSFAEQVLVMRDGQFMQAGTPEELFERPDTSFVGYFVGSPAMSFLSGVAVKEGVRIGDTTLTTAWRAPVSDGAAVQVGIRPEYVRIGVAGDRNGIEGRVHDVQDHGAGRVILLDVDGQRLTLTQRREDQRPENDRMLVRLPAEKLLPYVDGKLATLTA